MVAQDKWLHVHPQCSSCKEKGVKVKHSKLEKQCIAASGRKRNRNEAELVEAQRAANRHVAPRRNAGEDVVAGTVGRK